MKKRHTPEQIVAMLRQADIDLGKGRRVPEVCSPGSWGSGREHQLPGLKTAFPSLTL